MREPNARQPKPRQKNGRTTNQTKTGTTSQAARPWLKTIAATRKRQEDKRHRPGPPPPAPRHPTRLALVGGEVADQLVELGVGLRRQTACDALVELVVIEAAGQMLAAQDVRDRLALGIADPKLPVARAGAAAVVAVRQT